MKLEIQKVTFALGVALLIVALTCSNILMLKRQNEIFELLIACDDCYCPCACHEIVVE